MELTEKDVKILNSKVGVKNILGSDAFNIEKALRYAKYEIKLKEYQAQLVELMDWVIKNRQRVVVIFEGRDAAGKGGAIRRITSHINPRHFRVVALPKPNEEEVDQWYFQRYVNELPKPGHIVFFDRSWYNRAVVEPVNEFCTPQEYETFMEQVNPFEKMIKDSGTFLLKIYFSISKEEQARRFEDIKASPIKRWKMTPVDEKAQTLWDEYTSYKVRMFEHTHTEAVPWKIIKANRKTSARIEAIKYILDSVPYLPPSNGHEIAY
ncbi:MAG: polyphosphate kinase 2 [Bacteroidia bacterium]